MTAEDTAENDAPRGCPKHFVDFDGNTYGAHEIARNMGGTCPHCGVAFEFWGHTRGTACPPRRRCWWCAVTLRWWQLNSCRRCKRALVASYVGPPCRSRSRWDAAPDRATSPGSSEATA